MTSEMSVLDLPDLVLECILEKLPPDGLCRMASVCTSLRDKCISDHLWEKHMKNKWGKIVGPSAYKEWQCHIASRKGSIFCKKKGLMGYLVNLWPIALIRSCFSNFVIKKKSFSPVDSVMSWYLALESGKFWFPAQVYNRENGHVGFMLSCYDAVLSYDRRTDTFLARYPAHGTRASAIESGVTWDRLRAPLLVTLWSWSSTSTLVVRVGDEQLLAGKNIGKKEMRLMDFMAGSENFAAMKRFRCGESSGRLKYSSKPRPNFSYKFRQDQRKHNGLA
ncbi:hypothetical protein DH2020_027994 [Rehmannia glutinosa]|uniref:F-box domain-containing protein n=1 Tax=Rehmannia glutinosa TaxID=99300 RepID=A0ABR0VTG8_REHGL